MKIRHVLMGLLCGLLSSLVADAQPKMPNLFTSFPPSPHAASLGKFGEIPVSTYNGIPEISVPIWDVGEGDIKLPVSLNYHAGGIQVAEVASHVGLGWALNAGGVVTRVVRGLPDDYNMGNGFLSLTEQIPTSINLSASSAERDLYYKYTENIYDSQPDLFVFNVAGRTGKMQFDQAGNIYITPHQRVKMVPTYNYGKVDILKWTLTAEDGVVYTFEKREKTKNETNCIPNDFTPQPSEFYTTSWFLTKIVSPKGADIDLEYEDATPDLTYPVATNETQYTLVNGGGDLPNNVKCGMWNKMQYGTRLRRIKFDNGEIEFVPGTQRIDLPGDYRLDKIVVKNKDLVPIRHFQLQYGYMLGGNTIQDYVSATMAATNYRLALVSVQEKDGAGVVAKAPYKFEYNVGLPDRLDNAVDLFGFYNGYANSTLIPEATVNGTYYPGAKRFSSMPYTAAGTLSKIIYPTGGHTKFTYESNTADGGISTTSTQKSLILPCDNTGQSGQGRLDTPIKTLAFTLTSSSPVTLHASSLPCPPEVNLNECYCAVTSAIAINNNGAVGTELMNSQNSNCSLTPKTMVLNAGSYFLILKKSSTYPSTSGAYLHYFDARASWVEESTQTVNKAAPGIRIKTMETMDGNKFVSRKTYDYNDANGITYGKVLRSPSFWFVTNRNIVNYYGSYYTRTSSPTFPMAMTQGGYVGYAQVKVRHNDWWYETNTSWFYPTLGGVTIYKYTTPDIVCNQYCANQGLGFPFAPTDYVEWAGGDPLEVTDYNYQTYNSTLVPVRKQTWAYQFHADNLNLNANVRKCLGVKFAYTMKDVVSTLSNYTCKPFYFTTGYRELVETSETTYGNDPAQFVTETTKFTNSPTHLQTIKTEATESDGKRTITYTTYPEDYSDNTGFIGNLKTNNIIDAPIEQATYITDDANGTNPRIIEGSITTYKTVGAGLADQVYKLEIAVPQSLSTFRFSNKSTAGVLPDAGSPSSFYLNTSLYKPKITFEAYDNASATPRGNLLQWKPTGDVPSSAMWGYKNSLMVASIANAAINEVYYESFEENTNASATSFVDANNRNLAKTGRKVWAGTTFTCSFTVPNAKAYVMSYWYHDGTKWIFSGVKPYAASISIVGLGQKIDEIRVYPSDAYMTTYTHDVLIGLTSKTDENSLTEYYEYDSLGRLSLVRDNDGNILKRYTYNYKQ